MDFMAIYVQNGPYLKSRFGSNLKPAKSKVFWLFNIFAWNFENQFKNKYQIKLEFYFGLLEFPKYFFWNFGALKFARPKSKASAFKRSCGREIPLSNGGLCRRLTSITAWHNHHNKFNESTINDPSFSDRLSQHQSKLWP